MWEEALPDVDDHLRQGDLIVDVPFPRAGHSVTDGTLSVGVDMAIGLVIDRCCTVDQRKAVMLAKVKSASPGAELLEALRATQFTAGSPYARYAHLLHEVPGAMPASNGKVWTARLLERFSVPPVKHHADLTWLCRNRVARMTIPARAVLRAKLANHFGAADPEDDAWLAQNGYDAFGQLKDR